MRLAYYHDFWTQAHLHHYFTTKYIITPNIPTNHFTTKYVITPNISISEKIFQLETMVMLTWPKQTPIETRTLRSQIAYINVEAYHDMHWTSDNTLYDLFQGHNSKEMHSIDNLFSITSSVVYDIWPRSSRIS